MWPTSPEPAAGPARDPRYGAPLALLTVAVLVAHAGLAWVWPLPRLGEGAEQRAPKRIEVAFVRELAPSVPAPVAAAPKRRHAGARKLPAAAAEAASAPADALEPPPPAPEAAAQAEVAPAPEPTAAQPPQAAASAAGAFEWPPSTRLSYTLSGNYRGPVQGQAQVEWLRQGVRYQVHMDVAIGPSFAPLVTRRVSSQGEITAQGLFPQRYDEETRVALRAPRRISVVLDAERVHLMDGQAVARPEGVQDSASQFVQLTWLFTTQPHWLEAGRVIEMPLALPRRVAPWVYDVMGAELLDTPAGPVQAVHVRPRMPLRPGSHLTAELWVAPSLQHLPVRILIRQDDETYVDLLLERLPQQADQAPP